MAVVILPRVLAGLQLHSHLPNDHFSRRFWCRSQANGSTTYLGPGEHRLATSASVMFSSREIKTLWMRP